MCTMRCLGLQRWHYSQRQVGGGGAATKEGFRDFLWQMCIGAALITVWEETAVDRYGMRKKITSYSNPIFHSPQQSAQLHGKKMWNKTKCRGQTGTKESSGQKRPCLCQRELEMGTEWGCTERVVGPPWRAKWNETSQNMQPEGALISSPPLAYKQVTSFVF